MSMAEVALRCVAETSADSNFMWWLKCFASIGVLTVFWMLTVFWSWLSGRQSTPAMVHTASKSVQGPVTYTTRYQPLAEHAWGAW